MIMDIIATLVYISQAPYFWGTMGIITAMAMFFGVILYDGKLDEVGKALVGLNSYVGLLLWVNIIRINSVPEIHDHVQAYAGITTIIIVTLFWCIGLFVGVFISCLKGWKK